MEKKIGVIGYIGAGKSASLALKIASHDFLSNVTICESEPKEIKIMNDLKNELAGAMVMSYAGRWNNYDKPKGDNKQPKKIKRKRNKKTHR
jgi:hypothetical protein